MYDIYPQVKSIKYTDGYLDVKGLSIFFNDEKVNAFKKISEEFLFPSTNDLKSANIFLENDNALHDEAYWLINENNKVTIKAKSNKGFFYGIVSLKQLVKSKNKVRCCEIYDEPDLEIRGLLFDISRNKVATVATIKKVIQMMAFLKMNHLELYGEGLSFEYSCYQKYLKDESYLTKAEYLELEEYANTYFIDLVPNANGFGHMGKWLELDEFKDLAECPDGIFLWGRNREPSTLNPLDPRSLELVKKIYQEMLSVSHSKYFNMNFDEPFELGKGRSKEECEKKGLGNVYIDYALKAYDEVKKNNKIPMIWMDVLLHHPTLWERLPKDMIFLDWGYDAPYSFKKHLKMLKDLDVKFIAAPGTCSWCSFLGRTTDAFENIKNACQAAYDEKGLGVILTDWGDFGHLQFLPISYPEIVYGGLLMWRNNEGTYREVKNVLNKFIFKDENNLMADCLMDLGRYNRLENSYQGNGTEAFYTFMWGSLAIKNEKPVEYFLSKVKNNLFGYDRFLTFDEFFKSKLNELNRCKLECSDGNLIIEEIKESIRLVNIIHKVMIACSKEIPLKQRIAYCEEVVALKNDIFDERKKLWLARNKISDFDESIEHIMAFIDFADTLRKYLIRGEDL